MSANRMEILTACIDALPEQFGSLGPILEKNDNSGLCLSAQQTTQLPLAQISIYQR